MNRSHFLAIGVFAVGSLSCSAAIAAPVILGATLAGANETAGGDPDGSGSFTVEIDPDAGDFCYTVKARDIATPTMVHVHSGAAGTDGPPVVTITMAEDECIAAEPDVLRPIVATPGNYYVNVHTADYPKGAVRGQLERK